MRNIAEVTTAVAKGDLSKKITVNVRGEILELKNTINTMVDRLNSFASEVTRVAREVGTEGKLGGQAKVRGVAGTWKDLSGLDFPLYRWLQWVVSCAFSAQNEYHTGENKPCGRGYGG